jgi:hypothetical protein
MLYISPDHRENEEKVKQILKERHVNLVKFQLYLEKSLKHYEEHYNLLKPILPETQREEEEGLLCQAEMILSSLRMHNRLRP